MFFEPKTGFDIRAAAQAFAEKMIEEERPLVMRLLNTVFVEFEPGCTAKEIIDGYNSALQHAQGKYKASNSNDETDDDYLDNETDDEEFEFMFEDEHGNDDEESE